jgi:FKBP-type peptidyl-prolyl cis-trans isomerase
MKRHPSVFLLAMLLASAACASAGGPPPDISDTRFERSLQIDLASMTRTPSGLYYQDVKEGQYEVAKARQRVSVRYTGWLPNGTEVDKSDEGIEFRIGSGTVIRGWEIGIEGMRVGGVRKLVIPPELGYRYREVGKIPAGSVLVFRVELVRVRD